MRTSLLFDASSFLEALKRGLPELLYDNYIQWLTIYEVLNGLWKEARLVGSMSVEEAMRAARMAVKVARYMHLLSPEGLEEEILRVALEAKLSVYDASYIVLAKANKLTLVTEDKKLRRIASRLIETISVQELASETDNHLS